MLNYNNYFVIAYHSEYLDVLSLGMTNKQTNQLLVDSRLWKLRLDIKDKNSDIIDLDKYHYFPLLKNTLSIDKVVKSDSLQLFIRVCESQGINIINSDRNIPNDSKGIYGRCIDADSLKILQHYVETNNPQDITAYLEFVITPGNKRLETFLLNYGRTFHIKGDIDVNVERLQSSNLDINHPVSNGNSLLQETFNNAKYNHRYLEALLDNPQITGKYLRNEILDSSMSDDLFKYKNKVIKLRQISELDILFNSYIFIMAIMTFFIGDQLRKLLFLTETLRMMHFFNNMMSRTTWWSRYILVYLMVPLCTYIIFFHPDIYKEISFFSILMVCGFILTQESGYNFRECFVGLLSLLTAYSFTKYTTICLCIGLQLYKCLCLRDRFPIIVLATYYLWYTLPEIMMTIFYAWYIFRRGF